MRKNSFAFLLLLACNVNAAGCESLQSVFIIGIIFASLAIAYTYKQTQMRDGLEAQILRNKKIIEKQKKEIADNEHTLNEQKTELDGSEDKELGILTERMQQKSKDKATTGLRSEFWRRIESSEKSLAEKKKKS